MYNILVLINWTTDTTIAVSAIIVSVVGIIIGVVYNRKTFIHYKKHNELTVAPILDTYISTQDLDNGNVKLVINLKNEGFGPALIDSIKLILNDVAYESKEELLNIFSNKYGLDFMLNSSVNAILSGTKSTIGPGKAYKVVAIEFKGGINKLELQNFLSTINIEVSFSDIYKLTNKMKHPLYE